MITAYLQSTLMTYIVRPPPTTSTRPAKLTTRRVHRHALHRPSQIRQHVLPIPHPRRAQHRHRTRPLVPLGPQVPLLLVVCRNCLTLRRCSQTERQTVEWVQNICCIATIDCVCVCVIQMACCVIMHAHGCSRDYIYTALPTTQQTLFTQLYDVIIM
jgi:hypothetical protein